MRRADRLFQIIQILRRSTRPITVGMLAEELEVSKRSIYRDIADLIGQRAPVQRRDWAMSSTAISTCRR